MSNTQKSKSVKIFIDYIPAELRENKTWEIVYYVKNPYTEKLERKRNRVKPIRNKVLRRKYAKSIIDNLNHKLRDGWNPIISSSNLKSFAKWADVCVEFNRKIDIDLKKDEIRKDTHRTFKSLLKGFNEYLALDDVRKTQMFIIDFNTDLMNEFLYYRYYEKDNSGRTRNNYLGFFKTSFYAFLKERKYLKENPCKEISKVKESEKIRAYIEPKHRKIIFDYFNKTNKVFYTLCLCCYYCLIRRTELTKLKVKDVVLRNSIIYIESGNSKNRKSKPITIPDVLLPILADHLKNANNSDYLFSNNNFLPGEESLSPPKITDTWYKMRIETKLPKTVQWYALKDTGITDLLLNGVEVLRVRDQARHSTIQQTEDYIPKQILKADQKIKNSGIKFKK